MSATTRGAEASAETILVVDDDRAFCAALAGAMRRRGLKVMVAHDYDDAIAEADAWRPQLAVVDLRMPGRNGLEVIATLKTRLPDLRIVVLTGFGSIATAVEAIKLGAVHYLTKPADADEIYAALLGDTPVASDTNFQPQSLAEAEWEHIHRVLAECGGNISKAAQLLDIPRRTLQRKLKKLAP